jgi:alpha-L-fucosidase
MGGGWSYSFNAKMMPTRQLIHMLNDIVAKGGNLLLNIGPGPDGTWYEEAYNRLAEIGIWMKVNGDAIYGTRPIAPYNDGKLRFTKGKDGSANVIYLLDENEKLPAEILVKGFIPAKGAKISILGKNGSSLKWKAVENGFAIAVSESVIKTAPSIYAVTFKIGKVSSL